MRILLLTVYCSLLSVNAKLGIRTIEEKHATEVFDAEVPASRTSEHFKYAKAIRRSRNSKEDPTTTQNSTKFRTTSKPKEVLVKKPIPKFTDTGSDEYYQARMRFPNKMPASIEHEDEDFSVDDYEFDVNHDEYAGRGKPLEPRLVSKQRPKPPAEQAPPPSAPEEATAQHNEEKPSVKVARQAVTYKTRDDGYDDEFSAAFNSPENRIQVIVNDDTASDDSGEGKEELNRRMRTTRSSPFSFGTYMDKLGEKTSDYMSRMFSFLPLFPASYSSPDEPNQRVIAENDPSANPYS